MNAPFDVDRAIAQAESGDVSLWEDIARHLIAKRKRKPAGPKGLTDDRPTCVHKFYEVRFADGVSILRSTYDGKSKKEPMAVRVMAGAKFMRALALCGGRFMTDARAYDHLPAVTEVRELSDPEEIEAVREKAWAQREESPGWGKCLLDPATQRYRNGRPDAA